MKKSNFLKVVACATVIGCVAAFASCGGTKDPDNDPKPTPDVPEQKTDYSVYTKEQWLAEKFDGKDISYQFTGDWSLPENGFYYYFSLNLYKDGSMLVDQRNAGRSTSYYFYGYWNEETTVDGNEITLDAKYETSTTEGELIVQEYNYVLYEESDSTYSFGFSFGIAPGQYIRSVDVTGGKTILYSTTENFHKAVDKAEEPKPEEPEPEDPKEPEQTEKETSYVYQQTTNVNIGGEVKPNSGAIVNLYKDGTVNAQLGFAMNGKLMFNYGLYAEENGTWSLNGTTLTIVLGGKSYTVSSEAGSSFEWTVTYTNSEGASETSVATIVLS